MANDLQSLAHTRWNCKYHIVFAPKYRRQVFYGEKKREIGRILRQLCEWKGVEIHEAELCPDHIHMLVSIPPKVSVSSFMGYLKGKSSVLIYEKFGEMKYKYRNREFWCRGYYVDTVGKNTKAIAEYIKHQLEEDKLGEQMTMLGKTNDNPFTGSKSQSSQLADRISACEGAASILGLCPHMKSHRLCRWIVTAFVTPKGGTWRQVSCNCRRIKTKENFKRKNKIDLNNKTILFIGYLGFFSANLVLRYE